MMMTYIGVLVFSAGLMAFGFSWLHARLGRAMRMSRLLPPGVIALAVAAALLVVVAAPLWLLGIIAVLAALLYRMPKLPSAFALVPVMVVLTAAPLLGATGGFALDAALIGAAWLGESCAA